LATSCQSRSARLRSFDGRIARASTARARLWVGPLALSCGARPWRAGFHDSPEASRLRPSNSAQALLEPRPTPLRYSLRGAAAIAPAPALNGPAHRSFSPVRRGAPDVHGPACKPGRLVRRARVGRDSCSSTLAPHGAALLGAADARQQPHPKPCPRPAWRSTVEVQHRTNGPRAVRSGPRVACRAVRSFGATSGSGQARWSN